jgi:hypothetical protein
MSTSFPFNGIGSGAFSKNETMLTVKQLKTRYLFGVDLTDEQGNPIPEEVYQHNIDSAVSYLEHKLDIMITPQEMTERYDYRQIDYTTFNFIQLKKRPVMEVSVIKAKFPSNRELVTYPQEWYVIEKETGQIQLSPVEGTFSGLIVTHGGSYMPLLYGTRDYWPHLFEVTYKAGFCDDKIPSVINEMIGLQAAIGVFEILGDLVLGPGVAGESVNIDGAGVSKNLTASAMYSAYSARIESYRKKMDEYTEVVKKYYNAIPFAVV